MATNTIHTSGRQFWRKISGRITCTPPQANTRRKLQSHDRVGRHKVHRNHTRLVLQMETSASVTTGIHWQSTQTIQPHKEEKTKPTIPKRNHHIWRQRKYATQSSAAPLLDKKGKTFIQQVCGKVLFLGRAVNSTLICPISAIVPQSMTPTEETMKQTHQLLDYIATREDAVITYTNSNMKLAVHTDASYLSKPKAGSQSGGHFFLSNEATMPQNNGAILNIAQIIKHVMTSSTESELAALCIMSRKAVYIRIILEEMGHIQPPTPLQTDNRMADAVCNGKIQQKQTKETDMRFHWLRDREFQIFLGYIGDQANKTTHTTGQSTIQQPTTKTKEKIPNTTHHIVNYATRTATT